MTSQSDVFGNEKYVPVLDHGFVGLIDTMGTDNSIVQAARVSYGAGTKTVREDRGLIRYLVRHKHTSPLEMCQIKLHVKMPIFVMRQWVRHRTASLNEYSGRYSVMTDEFYLPEPDVVKPQSKDNKQGRSGELPETDVAAVREIMRQRQALDYETYQMLLGEGTPEQKDELGLEAEFGGIAREIARTVLPVSNYTELYWSQNLHNMLHLLKLRLDGHAQYEIRAFAEAVYQLIQPIYPLACEAFEDYVRGAVTASRMEKELLTELLSAPIPAYDQFKAMVSAAESPKAFALSRGLSERELGEFCTTWKLDLP